MTTCLFAALAIIVTPAGAQEIPGSFESQPPPPPGGFDAGHGDGYIGASVGSASLELNTGADCFGVSTNLYSISPDDDELRLIDADSAATLETIPIMLSPAGLAIEGGHGLAMDPATNAIFALLELDGQQGYELVELTLPANPADPAIATRRGNTGEEFQGLAFGFGGNLFAITGEAPLHLEPESIYKLDPADATTSDVPLLTLGDGYPGEAIAYNRIDGLIYRASGDWTQVLQTIDPNPGLSTTPILPSDVYGQATALAASNEGLSLFLYLTDDVGLYRVSLDGDVFFVGLMDHDVKGLLVVENDFATVDVSVDLRDADAMINGGQFSILYDKSKLQFMEARPGDSPFTSEILGPFDDPNFMPNYGRVKYAVATPNLLGTMEDSTMAVLTFMNVANQEVCLPTADLVQYMPFGGDPTFPNKLTDEGNNSILPDPMLNLPEIQIDVTAPGLQIGCPADIVLEPVNCPAVVHWDKPNFIDLCVGFNPVTSFFNTHRPGDEFEDGTTTVVHTAIDACGNVTSCSFDVVLTCQLLIGVTVDLDGPIVGETGGNPGPPPTVTRCICFEVYPTSGGPPVQVCTPMEFEVGDGTPQNPNRGQTVLAVPPDDYSCITAEGRLHTLRRTTDVVPGKGNPPVTPFEAEFVEGPNPGDLNKALLGGDLNDDAFLDIVDWGIKVTNFGTDYNPGDSFDLGVPPDEHLGAAVAVDGNVAVIGVPLDDDKRNDAVGGKDSGSAYVFRYNDQTGLWDFEAKLLAHDRAREDRFGTSVAVHGDTIVVGSPGLGNVSEHGGAAYVFEFDPDPGELDDCDQNPPPPVCTPWIDDPSNPRWHEVAKLVPTGLALNDRFGSSVAVHGEVVAVGSRFGNGNVADTGAAYVFEKPPAGWDDTPGDGNPADHTDTAKLSSTDSTNGDEFGDSVGIHGDVIAVGAPIAQVGALDTGAVYVFEKPGAGWADMIDETAKLTASDGAAGDGLGGSAAISGDVIVSGAADHAPNATGAAYVFVRPGGGWMDMPQTAKLTGMGTAEGDRFGSAVSISGDTIVVGAADDPDFADSPGAAYVFVEPWGNMTQTAKLTAAGGIVGDGFGAAAGISGGHVLIGAPFVTPDADALGAAYAFQQPGGGWAGDLTEDAELGPPGGHTACGTIFFHADTNGDGKVDNDDVEGFLDGDTWGLTDEPLCVLPSQPYGPPEALFNLHDTRVSVSIAELIDMGMGELKVADLNSDGFVDLVDVILFELGERP